MIKRILISISLATSLFATQVTPIQTNPIQGNINIEKMVENRDIRELEELARNNPYMADINFMIGVYYMAGDKIKNVEPNFEKAIKHLTKDENNLAMANYKIAEIYYYGGFGAKQDLEKSIYLEKLYDYEKAVPYLMRAAQEFNKVEAEMTLAFMYYEGKGILKNEIEANYWINKAYFNKDANGDIKAYISNYIEPVNNFNIESDVKNSCGVLR